MRRWRWTLASVSLVLAHTAFANLAFGRDINGREWFMWGWAFFLLIFVACLLAPLVDGDEGTA